MLSYLLVPTVSHGRGGAAYLWPCGPPPWDICLLPTTCASGFPGGCSPAAGEWPGRTRRGTRSLQEQEAGAKAPLRSTPRSRVLPCHRPAPNAPPGTLGALSLRASPRNPLLPCWGCPEIHLICRQKFCLHPKTQISHLKESVARESFARLALRLLFQTGALKQRGIQPVLMGEDAQHPAPLQAPLFLGPELQKKDRGNGSSSPGNSAPLSQRAAFCSSYLLRFHCLTRQCQNKFSHESTDLYSRSGYRDFTSLLMSAKL